MNNNQPPTAGVHAIMDEHRQQLTNHSQTYKTNTCPHPESPIRAPPNQSINLPNQPTNYPQNKTNPQGHQVHYVAVETESARSPANADKPPIVLIHGQYYNGSQPVTCHVSSCAAIDGSIAAFSHRGPRNYTNTKTLAHIHTHSFLGHSTHPSTHSPTPTTPTPTATDTPTQAPAPLSNPY